MSKKGDLWTLLIKREGEWLTRHDIEFVGGVEGMRRLREIRTTAYRAGYEIESRAVHNAPDEYRLVKSDRDTSASPKCVKCGLPAMGETQPTVDRRWRTGYCARCDKRDAIFAVPEPVTVPS